MKEPIADHATNPGILETKKQSLGQLIQDIQFIIQQLETLEDTLNELQIERACAHIYARADRTGWLF